MRFDIKKANAAISKAQAEVTLLYGKFRALPHNVQIGIVVAVLVFAAYIAGRVAG